MSDISTTQEKYSGKEKETDICLSNILAARGVADFIRTSLGPKGMDKMMTTSNKDVVVSNDGATILDNLEVLHPVARMLVELSKSQDIEAGDGTTTVVVLAGALLEESQKLIEKGIHPNLISESLRRCAERVPLILEKISSPVSIDDDKSLTDVAITSLSSKIVSPESKLLAPIAVKAIKQAKDNDGNVDLKNIRVTAKIGGTIEDSKLIDGLVFDQSASRSAGGPTLIRNAKIGLIQFQLSAPKTDMDFSLNVRKNEEIDRLQRDERRYASKIVQKIAKTGCNVLLVQKSIIRDALSPLSLHFLAKKRIMVVSDIERDDIQFIAKSLNLRPIASVDDFVSDKLGSAEIAEDEQTANGAIVSIRGIRKQRSASVLLRASSKIVLDEAHRSFHDALCVVRCLVRVPRTIPGGAAAESEIAFRTRQLAESLEGADAMCAKAFAEAMEAVPFTLAENCGLKPLEIIGELREQHEKGEGRMGIDVRKGKVGDMEKARVLQPALVSLRAVALATECVRMVLKIDGIVQTARD